MIAYIAFTMFLRLWLAGSCILFIVALGDVIFVADHSVKMFFKRVWLSIMWPLALVSESGRASLWSLFRNTQGV